MGARTKMTLAEQVLMAIDLIAARCPEEAVAAHKLRVVVRKDVRNPLMPKRFAVLVDNARTPDTEFSREELQTIGAALLAITELQDTLGGKPGPPKEFPVRVDLRISAVEQDAISRITERTGEDRSEIIRRLVREADAVLT